MIKIKYEKRYTATQLQDGDLFDFVQQEFEKEACKLIDVVEDFNWVMETDKDSHKTTAVVFIARGYDYE